MYSLFTLTLSADLMRENKIHIFIGVSFNKTALSALPVIIHQQMMSHALRNPIFLHMYAWVDRQGQKK